MANVGRLVMPGLSDRVAFVLRRRLGLNAPIPNSDDAAGANTLEKEETDNGSLITAGLKRAKAGKRIFLLDKRHFASGF